MGIFYNSSANIGEMAKFDFASTQGRPIIVEGGGKPHQCWLNGTFCLPQIIWECGQAFRSETFTILRQGVILEFLLANLGKIVV